MPEVRTLGNTLFFLVSTPLLFGNSATVFLQTNIKLICMYKLLSTLQYLWKTNLLYCTISNPSVAQIFHYAQIWLCERLITQSNY